MIAWLQTIDYSNILTSIAAFGAGIVVKTLLDLRLGIGMVKYFWWIRPRWIFGENPHSLGGTWEHTWGSGGSDAYSEATDRHDHATLRQLGRYFYADYISKKKRYYFFGRVFGSYAVGEWFDLKDRSGYYGTFELRIVNSDCMQGKWMGHSQQSHEIRVDSSVWKRVR
jgi:hypothetical protein